MGATKNLVGQRFGRLTVIRRNGSDKHKKALWLCKCDCGNEVSVTTSHLNRGNTKSCGCIKKEQTKEMWNNKEFRNMQTEQALKRNKELWQDEEFKQMHKERMSLQMKEMWNNEDYRNRMSGNNSPSYREDLTEEERQERNERRIGDTKFKTWSKQIKQQANYTCDYCGQVGGKLVSHHLNGWNTYKEQRYDLTNGVCLCEHCHKEFHKLYGKGGNTKEQYIEFKENKNKGDDK